MSIEVVCSCGKVMQAPDRAADRTCRCNGCGAISILPTPLDAEAIAAPEGLDAPVELGINAAPTTTRQAMVLSAYAGIGYTTAIAAAIPPLGARHAHHELRATPVLDKRMLVLPGNNHAVMDRIREGRRDRLRAYVAWVLGATAEIEA
jgi:formylmethanofuran dehydrogenase subunit A